MDVPLDDYEYGVLTGQVDKMHNCVMDLDLLFDADPTDIMDSLTDLLDDWRTEHAKLVQELRDA